MESKPHRTNSDFQLRHFLAGSCHTPDGAWMLLYSQKIHIAQNIAHAEAQRLRRESKIEQAEEALRLNIPEYQKKLARADIAEANSEIPTWLLNVEAAKSELATIEALMAELEPLRKYKDLPMLEANEAAQREEWLGELKTRAENYILTTGTIPADHFNTMRQHPDFESALLPYVREIVKGHDDADRFALIQRPFLALPSK